MSVEFEFYESPVRPEDEGKGARYHARPVTFSTVTTDSIVEIIHSRCALSRGDIQNALIGLSEVLGEQLRKGYRIHLEGIGYFQITLTCPKTKDPKDTRANYVKFKSVKFRADKNLKGNLIGLKTKRSRYRNHSKKQSDLQIDMLLTDYFEENQFLDRRGFQQICHLTKSTALKHIKRLTEEKKLQNIGSPKHPLYMPVPGNYRMSVNRAPRY
ncbi:MAG: HU family DNA-binding protein [Prevotella sp.]|jgi:predicted histone-like DNA-binding protein|nr:HU family DNA-binding protein [Prevotella sp.]